jgi:Spy/CpxP family protein refolding chaperone
MLRNAIKWAVIVGVSLAVTGVAAAQGQRQRQGGGMGQRTSPAALLANEDVQTELKLTDEQKEKVKAFAPAQGQRGQRQPGQPRGNRGQANPEAAKAAETFVKETLTPDQRHRFQQIRYQVMGVAAFNDEEVQKELKLTDEQKTKFKDLAEAQAKARAELFQGGRPAAGAGQELAQKQQAMAKEYGEKAQGILTEDQKKAWKDLTGAPFELRQRRRADV